MATTRQTKSKTGSTSKSKEKTLGAKPSKPKTSRATPKRAAVKPKRATATPKPTVKASGAIRTRTPKPTPSKESPSEAAARNLALAVASAALDKKAESVEVIDIRGRVDYADFLVVMSGRSDRHVVAVAQGIEQALKQQGHRCLGIEGLPQGQWVLMDYADVIAHVFHADRRGFYDLEGLWLDADRVPFASSAKVAGGAG
ncbi:MAG: ribosome silencing factor [Deltaproteobacteria bacterium]|nr:ribosome silencing factor [Deltaproteobacteria bacterium]